jgi:hydroxymethylbilane synthase
MSIHHIKIGSRGSDLALWQAHYIQNEIKTKLKIDCDITIIKTKGDKIQNVSFDKMEGKGFFTKEIEDALLADEIDLAIHSHKDLPTAQPEGLSIAAVSYREKVNDLLLVHPNAYDRSQVLGMKIGANLGTSSYRRCTQILAHRSDIRIQALRGNVPTRLNKLIEGHYDAIILASAGVERLNLNLHGMIAIELDPKLFIPAPAQGVLALQCREGNSELVDLLSKLNHSEVKKEIDIERSILERFDGGCQIALGVYVEKVEDDYYCYSSWSPDLKSVPYYLIDKSKNMNDLKDSCYKKLNAADTILKEKNIYLTKREDEWSLFKNFSNQYNYNTSFVSHIDITHSILTNNDIEQYQHLIITSKNAVISLSKIDQAKLNQLQFYVISKSTAEELSKLGVRNIQISPEASQVAMSKWLNDEYSDTEFLFLAGNLASNHFENRLRNLSRKNVYETNIKKLSPDDVSKLNQSTDILFSSTSNFQAVENESIDWGNKKVYAFGEQTASYINNKISKEVYLLDGQNPIYFISELIKQG